MSMYNCDKCGGAVGLFCVCKEKQIMADTSTTYQIVTAPIEPCTHGVGPHSMCDVCDPPVLIPPSTSTPKTSELPPFNFAREAQGAAIAASKGEVMSTTETSELLARLDKAIGNVLPSALRDAIAAALVSQPVPQSVEVVGWYYKKPGMPQGIFSHFKDSVLVWAGFEEFPLVEGPKSD